MTTVKQTDNAVPVEVLAQSIVSISAGIKKLLAGPINERGLCLLIQHAAPTTLSQKEIKSVLKGIADLEKTYLKK